jgi:hypothetical protein
MADTTESTYHQEKITHTNIAAPFTSIRNARAKTWNAMKLLLVGVLGTVAWYLVKLTFSTMCL